MHNSAKQKQIETLPEIKGNRQKNMSDSHTILDCFIEDKIISRTFHLNALLLMVLCKPLKIFKKVTKKTI